MQLKKRNNKKSCDNKEIIREKWKETSRTLPVKGIVIADRYKLIDRLGKGGYSIVYKAIDMKCKEVVAIKKYKTHDINNKKNTWNDIEREINVLKNTSHPGLPYIYNVLFEENEFYLVMEYVDGITLYEYSNNRKGFSKREVYNISKQILSVLYYLHSLEPPIIYRDIKPQNIMIDADNKIKLIDFGNAKKFNRDVACDIMSYGTPGFAAPEQYGDNKGRGLYNTDIRTDIYGAAALIYNIASGMFINNKEVSDNKRHTNSIYKSKQRGWFDNSENDKKILYLYKKIKYTLVYPKAFRRMIKKATNILPEQRFDSVIEMLRVFY